MGRWAAILAFTVIATTAVLYVPYFIPQPASTSYSWLFGYNNRSAVLLIFVFAAASSALTQGRFVTLRPSSPGQPIFPALLGLVLVGTFADSIWLYKSQALVGNYVEASYTIHRSWLLSLGKRPYVDFEWPFGLANLYIPVFFHSLIHLDFVRSVYLYWGLTALAGVLFLYAAINRLSISRKKKSIIFALLFLTSLDALQLMGPQYTLLRYCMPIYFILVVFDRMRNAITSLDWLRTVGFVWAAAIVHFLISPEMGAAFVFACCASPFTLQKHRWITMPKRLYGVMAFGFAVILWIAVRVHEFDTAMTSGSGSESLPLVLSPTLLLVVWAIALCADVAYQFGRERTPVDNTVALLLLTLPLFPAAFARADVMHQKLNLAGLLLAGLVYACRSRRLWPWFVGYAALALLALPYGHWLRSVVKQNYPQTVVAVAQPNPSVPASQVLPAHIDFSTLYPNANLSAGDGILEAPFSYYPTHGTGAYLSQQIDYGYYLGSNNADSLTAIQRRIEELGSHPQRAVLILKDHDECGDFNVAQAQRNLQSWNGAPYRHPGVHLKNPMSAICSYIEENYLLAAPGTQSTYEYELWLPKPHRP